FMPVLTALTTLPLRPPLLDFFRIALALLFSRRLRGRTPCALPWPPLRRLRRVSSRSASRLRAGRPPFASSGPLSRHGALCRSGPLGRCHHRCPAVGLSGGLASLGATAPLGALGAWGGLGDRSRAL